MRFIASTLIGALQIAAAYGALAVTTDTQQAWQILQVPNIDVGGGQPENAFTTYDAGFFTPLGDLDALSSSDFTVLGHPAFPKHNVRVKQSHFCDGTVR